VDGVGHWKDGELEWICGGINLIGGGRQKVVGDRERNQYNVSEKKKKGWMDGWMGGEPVSGRKGKKEETLVSESQKGNGV
jgi:hypothetical protein